MSKLASVVSVRRRKPADAGQGGPMTDIERCEAVIRREVVRIVREAKKDGENVSVAWSAASAWAVLEHRAATRVALKRLCNPIDVLSRSDKLMDLTLNIIDDVIRDVYGACSC